MASALSISLAALNTALNSFEVQHINNNNSGKLFALLLMSLQKDAFWIDYSIRIIYRCLHYFASLCFSLLATMRCSDTQTLRNGKQRQWQTTIEQQLNKHGVLNGQKSIALCCIVLRFTFCCYCCCLFVYLFIFYSLALFYYLLAGSALPCVSFALRMFLSLFTAINIRHKCNPWILC